MKGLKYLSFLFSFNILLLQSCNLIKTRNEIEINDLVQKTPIQDFKKMGAKPLSQLLEQKGNASRTIASIGKSSAKLLHEGEIHEGEVFYLDHSVEFDKLVIHGTLYCDESKNADETIILRAKTIEVHGLFQCGTILNPYNKKLIISLIHDYAIDPYPIANINYRGLIVHGGGKLILQGNSKNASWFRLNKTINPGDQEIEIDSNQEILNIPGDNSQNQVFQAPKKINWSIGDTIAIAPSGFNYNEGEKFTIVSIDKFKMNKFKLNKPVQFKHWGEKQEFNKTKLGNVILDERAEVANLSRNIVIRADEDDFSIDESASDNSQLGGHVMVHAGGKAYINSVEFYKMGQAGVLARYPFHWHIADNVPGQYIINSSIHHSYQRCVTIHQSNYARVENNVCYDFKGHGYFLESGNEVENVIRKNLAIMAKAPDQTKLLLQSDNVLTTERQGRFSSVSGFWISNPKNIVTGNRVAGSIGSGFWMPFVNQFTGDNGIEVFPRLMETKKFEYNTAHSTQVGFTWDGAPNGGLANNPNNPDDRFIERVNYNPPAITTFKGLVVYKTSLTGVYFSGQTSKFENIVAADNGWSFWISNQVIKNSILIGKTNNTSAQIDSSFYNYVRDDRYRKTGIILYDGPLHVENVDFLNFSTAKSTYVKSNGATVNNTVIPFTIVNGTNKFTDFVKGLRFIPDPIHRIHLFSVQEKPSQASYLGNQAVRDLDGSLSGTGQNSFIVANRSLGLNSMISCQDGGDKYYGFKICPQNYTEGSFNFMRWGGNLNSSPWVTPFVVIRNDGATNFPYSEWLQSISIPNNAFATVPDQIFSYELLPFNQYSVDYGGQIEPRVEANAEKLSSNSPIVKIVAYGNNCQLVDDFHPNAPSLASSSLKELKQKQSTSYFTSGENFYIRLVPNQKVSSLANFNETYPTGFATNYRYLIKCDSDPIKKVVKGAITSVVKTKNNIILSGWACNYTHSQPIDVSIFAFKKNSPINTVDYAKSIQSEIIPNPSGKGVAFGSVKSNLSHDARTAVDCGRIFYPGTQGRKFQFTIPKSQVANLKNYYFYIKGISNTSGVDKYLNGSGFFPVN